MLCNMQLLHSSTKATIWTRCHWSNALFHVKRVRQSSWVTLIYTCRPHTVRASHRIGRSNIVYTNKYTQLQQWMKNMPNKKKTTLVECILRICSATDLFGCLRIVYSILLSNNVTVGKQHNATLVCKLQSMIDLCMNIVSFFVSKIYE